MEFSPRCSQLSRKLYRTWMFAVTLTAAACTVSSLLVAQAPLARYGRKTARDMGPRAVGLIQLSPKGDKGRLIPLAIMMDGKFYDAGSYKASPVPLALDFDTVYEGFRAGVSQGVFTITQPGQMNHAWMAEGKWLPAGMKAPETSKKYAAPVIADDDKDAPPVLHRHSEKSDVEKDAGKKDQDKDAAKSEAPDKKAEPDKKPDEKKAEAGSTSKSSTDAAATSGSAKAAPAPETAKPEVAATDQTIADPNRPRLRRGKPDASPRREPFTNFDEMADEAGGTPGSVGAKTAKDPGAPATPVVTIPAISDAGGPDPRPYTYEMKPQEEATYRSRMVELAGKQLAGTRGAMEGTLARKKIPGKSAAKTSTPELDNVSLRVFDLSSSNEPILVLSAKTHPAETAVNGSIEEPKEITLIARTNLEGELKKLFFSQTDSHHLDVTPRMELVDAVDADGDGRGELLFRRTFDGGSTYGIYRVSADGLWPLFEGAR